MTPSARWPRNPVIYEINTLPWLNGLSRRYHREVTLASVDPDEWDALAAMHIDAVWLMGVWERSPRGIEISNANASNVADFRRALPDFKPEDNAGSAYCIRRYTVDPKPGGDKGLAVARHELARRGIRLILDFVPNHMAHDHPWADELPDIFIRGTEVDLAADPVTFNRHGTTVLACGKDPNYPAWQDVLQVNAFHPLLRAMAVETVSRIATMCDGVRCDMAMLMMNDIFDRTWGPRAGAKPVTEYWEELIPAVRRTNPSFLFIAEAYWDTEWHLLQQGFDYCYDKRLYDRMAHENASAIRDHLQAPVSYQERLIRFTENHDEPRHAVTFGQGRERAAALMVSTLPGAKLFYDGQFEGKKVRLPVFLAREPEEHPDTDTVAFWEHLQDLITGMPVQEGSWHFCNPAGTDGSGNLLAWEWLGAGERYLVAVNWSGEKAEGMVALSEGLSGVRWTIADLFSDRSYNHDGDQLASQGLYISLGPWGFHLLQFLPD